MKNNYIGNVSTILKSVLVIIAGWCIGYFASKGLNLPLTETELAEIFSCLICCAVAYIDAKYPNTFEFLGNAVQVKVETEQDLINQDYYEET